MLLSLEYIGSFMKFDIKKVHHNHNKKISETKSILLVKILCISLFNV